MIVDTQEDLEGLCADLKTYPFITIDTEFLREKTYYPKLCLVQVGTPEGNAAAIDPINTNLDLSPLFDVIFDEKVLKVIHSGRQDLEIFFNLTGKVVHPIFDTQIAAKVCGYGDSVGYENLVRNLTGASLDKSVQFTDWSKRPLSQRQIDYALGDVIHLVEVYRKLTAELDKRGRTEWVFQEEEILEDPATYQNNPDEAWERIKIRSPKPKTLAVLKALAAWRERQAQRKNIPRSWVMRDETVADMAAQMPGTPEQLAKIRGVSEDLAFGGTGRILLDTIDEAVNTDKSAWPKVPERKMIPPQAQPLIEILKMLLRIQCAQHDVAAKLVASSEDIEALAMDSDPENHVLKGWRHEVFGRDALALKAGKISIGLKNGRIVKHEIPE
ncbi:MAG: ribonuclease D [Alphaproteobacteria bacterium]|nr:ribonuclease D [Alphaproteobacteria bacterium]